MRISSARAILTLCVAVVATLVVTVPLYAQETPAAPAAAASDTAAAKAPVAVVDEPVYDHGQVSQGEEVRHDFVIRNEGNADLQIVEVRPACGCTVAEYDKTIPPGGSGKVHAVVDTSDFDGGISKGLTVLTNDPKNPRIVLTVKATIEPAVFTRPGFARFIQPKESDPGSVEQLVFTKSKDDLKILKVESPFPYLEATVRPATDEEKTPDGTGNQYVVTLTLDYHQAPVGPLADFVKLTTNHPKQAVVNIPVSGFVRPMVVATPDAADFGEIKYEGNADAVLVVKNYGSEQMKLSFDEAGSTLPPGIGVKIEQIKQGREYSVRILLDDALAKGPFSGTLRLKTDMAKKPTLDIPLRGTRV